MENKKISLNRRKFISSLATGAIALGASSAPLARTVQTFSSIPSNPQASPYGNAHTGGDFWDKPRVIRLKRWQNSEEVNAVYWRNGKLDIDGYRQICWLFRDLSVNQWVRIDVRLLDLLCAMQSWVGYYGFNKPFLLSSGYRTPGYNNSLEGAAKNSMHIHGRAADLIFPDLPVSYIGKLAEHYSAGGVGFYPSRGFTHIDTGRIRTWGRRG